MKKIAVVSGTLILGILMVLNLMSFTQAKPENVQNVRPYILVEIYEVPDYANKGIYIHRGNGKTDYIPFNVFKADNHDENGELILSTVNKLVNEGYELEQTTSGLAENGMITKIFLRKI